MLRMTIASRNTADAIANTEQFERAVVAGLRRR